VSKCKYLSLFEMLLYYRATQDRKPTGW